MPIDFTTIESGEDFELLCEDLLRAMGFTIEAQVARGPDLGRDIIVAQTATDQAGITETHRYLVECKHYARSGRAVHEKDIGSPLVRMGTYNCNRFLLITSTVPSEKVRAIIASVSNAVPGYKATIWSKGDLMRLLDQNPDVRERYFMQDRTSPLASKLARSVDGLLAVMGFACEMRQPTPSDVRLVCTSKGAFSRPVTVLCKENPINLDDVETLLAEVKEQSLGGGILVSSASVSPAAQQRAATTEGIVRVFTLSELYRELIDFEPYVRRLIAEYSDSELSAYYVDLGCRSTDGSIFRPMDDYIDIWLDNPERNHITILGDYGAGKTSFCRQYAAKQARRWLADPDWARIPILINLRDYTKTLNVDSLITDALVNQYGISGAAFEAFQRYDADGKLLVFFDGFDEMARRTRPSTAVDSFWELAKVVVPRSKVILTCRTPYIRTHYEAAALLQGEVERVAEWPDYIDLRDRPEFEIVHLEPFSDEDIQAMLQKRFPEHWADYWKQIQSIYNLSDLVRRPVLLDMIAKTLPDLREGETINTARLYQVYTDGWLERDIAKGRMLITPDDRRLFAEELAVEMLRRDTPSIHYSRIPERVRGHFGLEKSEEIDHFEADVRLCNFLTRDNEGNYAFAHKLFIEFFAASRLHRLMLADQATSSELVQINEEIRVFLNGLFALMPKAESKPTRETPEDFVWVPPGEFILGGEHGLPLQVARLEEGIFLATTPVTNSQYARFVAETGHPPPMHWEAPRPPSELADHPVVNVTWHDSIAYTKWAGGRLPTEQEWEKASRGYDGRLYPWGEGTEDWANTIEVGLGGPSPASQLSPAGDSPYGAQGMIGNVWEWTASEGETGTSTRVIRGGSFAGPVVDCSVRLARSPGIARPNLGFRIAIDVAVAMARPPIPAPEPTEELVRACVGNECVLYAGWGLSAQAGFPTWRAFAGGLLEWATERELVGEKLGGSLRSALRDNHPSMVVDGIANILQTGQQAFGRERSVYKYLQETFLDPLPSLPESHHVLSQIKFSAILTSSFDTLLERTHERLRDRVYTLENTDSLLEALTKREQFILRLCGTLERPETVLIGPRKYGDAVSKNRQFSDFIGSLFFSRTILFIDASFEEIEAYLEGSALSRRASRQHYALVPVTGSAWQARAELLASRYGIQVLPYVVSEDRSEVTEFLKKLEERVRSESEKAGRTAVKPGYVRASLENIGPFEHLELNLSPQWNILLGDNGVGKSTILEAIAVAVCGKAAQPFADRLIKIGSHSARVVLETARGQYLTEIHRTETGAEINSVPTRPLEAQGWLTIGFPPLRTLTWEPPKSRQTEDVKSRVTVDDLLPLARGNPDSRLDELKGWIMNLDHRIKDEQSKRSGNDTYERLLQEFFRVFDRLTGDMNIQFREVDLNTRQIRVITDDGEVPIESVSQGTASLIGWAGFLLQRLYEVYDDADNPREQYALVLVDEIDAHMHPEWQQTLIPKLSEIFPNIQFIATTHSPLIVGGMPVEQVFRFARDEDGKVFQLSIEPDMTMGRTDQVLTGSLFGLETTLDAMTQKEIEEYQKLLGKRKRTSEEEMEFQRLHRLLQFRIPVPQETPPERRAQEMLHALLMEQVGDLYPEIQEQVEEKAKQLLAALQTREKKTR